MGAGGQSASSGLGLSDVDAAYGSLAEHMAFYPGRVQCTVGDEAVMPQPGEFYGGWITNELVGPFRAIQAQDTGRLAQESVDKTVSPVSS